MRDWRNLNQLRTGTPAQRLAVSALEQLGLLECLADFDPVLAGTFPLDIQIEGSDLDLLCYAPNLHQLEQVLAQNYARLPNFILYRQWIRGQSAVISRFDCYGFTMEVFGATSPIEQQDGFRHLLIEHRLLEIGGAILRERVRSFKRKGLKTEPAFAQVLHLSGNAYEALLDLEQRSDEQLKQLVLRFI
jgi:hypothetical protein